MTCGSSRRCWASTTIASARWRARKVSNVARGLRGKTVTVIGLTVALMIGGAVVTETVFGLPGVGNLVVSAVVRRDYPVIQGALLVVAVIYVVINFLIDLLYTVVDPRVKY